MTRPPVTQLSNRTLVDDAHNAWITSLAVAAAIDHRGQVLLTDGPAGCDFDWDYELPTALVPPGQTLTDALEDLTSQLAGGIEQITGYLGHHDQLDAPGEPVRIFGFTLTASDPAAICRGRPGGHQWAFLDDLPENLTEAARTMLNALPVSMKEIAGPGPEHPLAEPLRAWARGYYCDEAAVELLIAQDVFLNRASFTGRFIDHADGASMASIDWDEVISALDAGELACSGGERRLLRIQASLGAGAPVSLRSVLSGNDTAYQQLIVNAVRHAAGNRPPKRIP